MTGLSIRYNSFMRNMDAIFGSPEFNGEGGPLGIDVGVLASRERMLNGDIIFDYRIGYHISDEITFSLLIRNIGESEGNARLYVVIDDVFYYGDYLQLEPNSAGEIMLIMDSLDPGQYSIGWGISSFDSRITNLNSSDLTFSVLERQSINLEIVDLDWKVNGLEATISANLDSYRERNVDLIFSDYNLNSADLSEIFRVPVTLGSASQTFTINLGEQTGQAIHLSASGVDWQEEQNWGVYLEYQPRSYGYYMNFADFPNPKNPVAGSEAIAVSYTHLTLPTKRIV